MTSVLITRPYKRAIHSQTKIKNFGIHSIMILMIKIHYCDIKINNNDEYIILTSQNAVRSININPWTKHKSMIVVGNKTKKTLLKINCTNILFYQYNGVLLRKLIEKRISIFSKILYLHGDHLSYAIAKILTKKKYRSFSRIVAKSFTLISLLDIQICKVINTILFYSPKSAEISHDLTQKCYFSMRCKTAICINTKCAKILSHLSWKDIKNAPQSNKDTMLSLL